MDKIQLSSEEMVEMQAEAGRVHQNLMNLLCAEGGVRQASNIRDTRCGIIGDGIFTVKLDLEVNTDKWKQDRDNSELVQNLTKDERLFQLLPDRMRRILAETLRDQSLKHVLWYLRTLVGHYSCVIIPMEKDSSDKIEQLSSSVSEEYITELISLLRGHIRAFNAQGIG